MTLVVHGYTGSCIQMCASFYGWMHAILLTFYWTLLLHRVHTVASVAYCVDDYSQYTLQFSR